MTHIRRIDENISRDYAMSVLENILDSDDFSVEIVNCGSGANCSYKDGEMVEYLSEFIGEVRSMAEKCNGGFEISTGDNMTYNVFVTDENDETYASIDFRLVYYRDDSAVTLQAKFDSFEY